MPKTATNGIRPVGVTEIAEYLGVKPDTVNKWRDRHESFPAPRWTVSGYLAWNLPDVVAWFKQTGRSGSRSAR